MSAPAPVVLFGTVVQDFFVQRLVAQRNASPRTVASYRDTFRLLLRYLAAHGHPAVATLTLADVDAPVVLAFLDHLERDRGNTVRSHNGRLAALRAFYHYAASRDPAQLPIVQRVLAIPRKRHDRPVLGYLTPAEMQAVLAAPALTTWSGRRDQVLLTTLYNTGARVSEVTGLQARDFAPGPTATLHVRGKGRKERRVPLWPSTARLLVRWLAAAPGVPERPLFPNRGGHPMTRAGVAFRLRLAVARASGTCVPR